MGELIRPSSSPSLPRLFFSLLFSSVASKRAVPKWCYRKFRNPRMSKVMQVLLIFSSLFPIVKFVELYLFKHFFFSLFYHIIFSLFCHPFRITSEVSTARGTSRQSHQKDSYNSRITNTSASAQLAKRGTRRSERPSRVRRRNASTQPPSTLPQRALARGCPSDPVHRRRPDRVDLRDASPVALREWSYSHLSCASPPPTPCVWRCILYPFSIAFICRRKRPMLHGHLHTLVNIGVEGFYIITGSFEKDRRKGYISPGECAVAFYVVIIE